MIGERLKKLRTNSCMSVRNLAQKVGVSPSFIYQLEQGKVSPSFSTLRSIAAALNTNISVLAGDDIPEEWEVVRRSSRRKIVTGSGGFEVELCGFLGPRNKKMQPALFRLAPGCEHRGFIYDHDREDVIYLQEGSLEITVGGRVYSLEAGDVAYFMFDHPDLIRNPGDKPAVGIWVVCPPGA